VNAHALAYFIGTECAIDRLLLANRPADAAKIAQWTAPRLPIGGGDLIERGLTAGPVVARTLRALERRWVDRGFPTGADFDQIVMEALKSANN